MSRLWSPNRWSESQPCTWIYSTTKVYKCFQSTRVVTEFSVKYLCLIYFLLCMKHHRSNSDRTRVRRGSSEVWSPWKTDDLRSVLHPAAPHTPRHASGRCQKQQSETAAAFSPKSTHHWCYYVTGIKICNVFFVVVGGQWHDRPQAPWCFHLPVEPPWEGHACVGAESGSEHGQHGGYSSSDPQCLHKVHCRW